MLPNDLFQIKTKINLQNVVLDVFKFSNKDTRLRQ